MAGAGKPWLVGPILGEMGEGMTSEQGSRPPEPAQDPQDKAFGAAAARDEERVDELVAEGEEGLPEEGRSPPPRAGGKAPPRDAPS